MLQVVQNLLNYTQNNSFHPQSTTFYDGPPNLALTVNASNTTLGGDGNAPSMAQAFEVMMGCFGMVACGAFWVYINHHRERASILHANQGHPVPFDRPDSSSTEIIELND
jgi:hypothetical protein